MKTIAESKLIKVGGTRIYQYLAAISANLGIICSEMHYGWTSPSLPLLRNGSYTFTITSTDESWIAVTPLIGAILGALITGLVVDFFGRKRLVLFSSVPFVVSWLCIAIADSSMLLYIGRFIAGMTDGLSFTAVPMYLGEIAEPQVRGLIASVCPLCIVFGILLINILGSYLAINTTAYVAIIIPILLICTFAWMPESPYFYIMRGKFEEARRSLQLFRGETDVSEDFERISSAVKEQKKSRGNILDIVREPGNRKALYIALGLRGVQQLSGTTAIIFFCNKVFTESGNFMSPNTATIMYFSIQLVMSAIASYVVDKSGRRPLLIVSLTGTTITLLVITIYFYIRHCTFIDVSGFNFVPVAALLAYIIIFSLGLQTIPLLVMGEIFPTNVKGMALCIADIYYSIIVTIISKYFYWTNERFGMHVPFFTFTVCCIFGLAFVVKCVPETKGKTLEEIQEELRK